MEKREHSVGLNWVNAMPKIEIYTTHSCPFCIRAKELLKRKGAEFEEIRIDLGDNALRETMLKRSGGKRTVPQIFINDHSIGGFSELWALEQSGNLNDLLLTGEAR